MPTIRAMPAARGGKGPCADMATRGPPGGPEGRGCVPPRRSGCVDAVDRRPSPGLLARIAAAVLLAGALAAAAAPAHAAAPPSEVRLLVTPATIDATTIQTLIAELKAARSGGIRDV